MGRPSRNHTLRVAFGATAILWLALGASPAVAAADAVLAGGEPVRTGLGECLRTGERSNATDRGACATMTAPPVLAAGDEHASTDRDDGLPVATSTRQSTGERSIELVNAFVLFDSSSAALRPDGRRELTELVVALESEPDVWIETIEVIGHADASASRDYNHRLSLERARTVESFLAAAYAGVPLVAIGLGELDPVASNDTPVGRQANRRVEIRVRVSKAPPA